MRRALLAAAVLAAACGPREGGPIARGSTVTLEYALSSGGKPVEASDRDEPLEVVLGTGQLPEPVETALLGLKPGEEKTVELPAGAGFGPHSDSLVEAVPRKTFGDLAKGLKPGGVVAGARGGRAQEARIVSVSKDAVLLDFNHPLAGKALTYRFKVLTTKR